MTDTTGVNPDFVKQFATLPGRCPRGWKIELAGGSALVSEAQAAAAAKPGSNGFPFLWEARARREIGLDLGVLDDG